MIRSHVILHADDDVDDRLLTADAVREAGLVAEVRATGDGVETLDYLFVRGKYGGEQSCPRPDLILLDLNMPRMDGREALRAIKSNEQLRHIPIVVLSTSRAEEDVNLAYRLGVNSFIVKPVSFQKLVEIIRQLGRYWFEVVELPRKEPI